MKKIFSPETIQKVHLSTVVFALIVVGLGAFLHDLKMQDWDVLIGQNATRTGLSIQKSQPRHLPMMHPTKPG